MMYCKSKDKHNRLTKAQWEHIKRMDEKIDLCIEEIRRTGWLFYYKRRGVNSLESYSCVSPSRMREIILKGLRERKHELIAQREALLQRYIDSNGGVNNDI